ncbi:MAG: glycosyltransferase family protein [Burkholderiales bacterium]
MSVAFLTYDLIENKSGEGKSFVPGGCGFYRCMLPMRAIGANAMGHPAWDPNRGFGIRLDNEQAIFGFGTVMLKLLFDAWIPSQIEQAKAIGQRIVIDVDDHYDSIPVDNPARKGTETFRSWNREHYAASILLADTITVTTPFLLHYYSALHPDVRMVRNSIQEGMFVQKKPTGRRPTIGYVGAVPWKTADLEPLREWLPAFLEDNDLMFHHSGDIQGHKSFADATGIDPLRVTVLPMVQINQYNRLFAPIDIGLVPLELNDFNAAKSNIKGLEYAANGIPFVASPTPEYLFLANDGVGRVASTPQEWMAELTGLLDYGTRRKEAAVNAASVRERWSMGSRTDEWKAALL